MIMVSSYFFKTLFSAKKNENVIIIKILTFDIILNLQQIIRQVHIKIITVISIIFVYFALFTSMLKNIKCTFSLLLRYLTKQYRFISIFFSYYAFKKEQCGGQKRIEQQTVYCIVCVLNYCLGFFQVRNITVVKNKTQKNENSKKNLINRTNFKLWYLENPA